MKQFLLVIPVILLVLLNACGGNGTATSQNVIVSTSSPTTTSTPDPRSSQMFEYLNLSIEEQETADKYNQLEHITGASYQITNVDLPPDTNMSPIFRIDVRCECTVNARCCSPTRTFVVTVKAIENRNFRDQILYITDSMTINILEVWISDHADLTYVISAPWQDVKNFIYASPDSIGDGFLLASKVTAVPQP